MTYIPVKIINKSVQKTLQKPEWIKIKLPKDFSRIEEIKLIMRQNKLHSVCEEAACPNLPECFNRGTATFMILGNICTRKCPFCNVIHGRPHKPSDDEPKKLAKIIQKMSLKYVVITSVNRDDLKDGGANHFSQCIKVIRKNNSLTKIEILVPDFRNCVDIAIKAFKIATPDVFNHNIENVNRLYKIIRPGGNYKNSLNLLKKFKKIYPHIPTKSGIMVGLGEKLSEIFETMHDLRSSGVTRLTVGQYMQPSAEHLPIKRYFSLDEFQKIKEKAIEMGFQQATCGPFVRSSYHADKQI
ncbi:lipoyl synthase [Candidatus Tachikawaea gelatinosa]|uniref:Lipoyl synthase n=1 Tax=Candidatus Tachikawaea gelatinosa TaxID=1410383 RepID=A0A090AQ70_9ENTR|nr:lipoyl synthase [Candidatus Tachikawaea gelatinosa]